MMRAMLLEYPEDWNVRNLSTQYMLGESLLVAPVFDQQKHMIYLPEGSWIDLEAGSRVNGGKWINHPKQIDVIPLFLRENRMIPMLPTAPDHIDGSQFNNLTLVMNITGSLEQRYYDDSVDGSCRAELNDGILSLILKDIPAAQLRIYCDREIRQITVNGTPRMWKKEDGVLLVWEINA